MPLLRRCVSWGTPLLIKDRFCLFLERVARFLVGFHIVIFLGWTQWRATYQGLLILGPLLVVRLHRAHALGCLHYPGDERGSPESLLANLSLHGWLRRALGLNACAFSSGGLNRLFFEKHVGCDVIFCREMSFLASLGRLWSNLYQILVERVYHLSRISFVVVWSLEGLLLVMGVKSRL